MTEQPWDPYRDGAESWQDAHVRQAQQPGMRHPGWESGTWPAPLALVVIALVAVAVLAAGLVGAYELAADLAEVLP